MARLANLPVTGPRAGSHDQAATLQRQASDMLADRDAMKRAAALKPAGADQSRENASRVRTNHEWLSEHRDSMLGTTRTA
jgi:hypothetical protein